MDTQHASPWGSVAMFVAGGVTSVAVLVLVAAAVGAWLFWDTISQWCGCKRAQPARKQNVVEKLAQKGAVAAVDAVLPKPAQVAMRLGAAVIPDDRSCTMCGVPLQTKKGKVLKYVVGSSAREGERSLHHCDTCNCRACGDCLVKVGRKKVCKDCAAGAGLPSPTPGQGESKDD